MYVGIPNTAMYNFTESKGRRDELRGFKLKRAVHGSVDLRELPPVVTIGTAITRVKDEQRT